MTISQSFPSYSDFDPLVPVRLVSKEGRPTIHRFYDTSPVSPSGKYITYTEFDYEDRLPVPGDEASVVVMDLSTGAETFRTRTIAWDTQLGAQAQWGLTDRDLFFNRMDSSNWVPYGVQVDPATRRETRLGGTVYMVSPDGRSIISPNLVRIWLVQPGYGVIVPDAFRSQPMGAPEDDGLFITDVATGACRLLLSFRRLFDSLSQSFPELPLEQGGFYGFHTKWSPDGSRIFFIVRWKDQVANRKNSLNWLVTMRADGSELQVAITPEQWSGGHHPNWCPDSEHIVMNLVLPDRRVRMRRLRRFVDRVHRKVEIPLYRPVYILRIARFRYDGTGIVPVSRTEMGSGHPTWHDGLNAVLTDAYPWEPVAAGDGTSPLRLISADTGQSVTLVRTRTRPDFSGPRGEWRVDPHPAWTRAGDFFAFNACPTGVRGVFIADMREYGRHS